ncbi:MAG TPA: hypothetical protein VNG71_08815, partial [Pyrinomonadaceae bacterium]|nr:hypothetical protein [Pyrinomonadaceae bacterium]
MIDYSLVTGGSAGNGDTIQYFVVAQDSAATPNVTSNPLTGAAGFSADPPAASTPPTPNSYAIAIIPKYQSRTSGNWNDFNTWEVDFGSGFAPAVSGQTPTSADDTIAIRNTHQVTVTADVDADQLTVQFGGILLINSGITLTVNDGSGTDLTVDGDGTLRFPGDGKISGAGSFQLSSMGNLMIGSADGITTSGATGNVQTAGRTYDASGQYYYAGSVDQVTGNGLTNAFQIQVSNQTGTVSLSNDVDVIHNFEVFNGAICDLNTHVVSGAGFFRANSGSAIKIGSAAGITSSGATGNVQTSTRIYQASAYIYNGALNQSVGNGLPSSIAELTIANTGGGGNNTVTLAGDATVNGTLTLTSGALAIGANTLTLNGVISATSGRLTGGATSNVAFGGATANTTLPAVSGGLNNLTINRVNGITEGADLIVEGTLTLTNGAFSIGANTLTLNGAVSYGAGLISGGATSNITVGGSSASTSLTNISLNNLTINRANGISLSCGCAADGAVTVAGTLTLTNGKITTSSSTLLSITNTAANAISGGSASSYINGPLARALPASLVSGNTYTFPVGKGTFNPFEMVNPTTSVTATIQAEVFDANSGGTVGTGLLSLNTNRYWQAAVTSGAFTNTKVKLTDSSIVATTKIGKSSTQSGTYDSIGGTILGQTITSNTITSFSFFNLGNGGNTISGTLFDANENPITTSKTIRLLQNGSNVGTTTTDVNGDYTFNTLALAAGDRLAVFIDGQTEKGATVTLSPASDISGLNLYQNRLVVRSDNGSQITNGNLKNAQGGTPDPDITAVYTVDNSGVLTTLAGFSLQIWTATTFNPGAPIHDGGDWINNATFVANTVDFNGSANQTIRGNNSTTFGILLIQNTGASPNNVVSLDGSAGATNTVCDVLFVGSGVFDQGTGSGSSSLTTLISGDVVTVAAGANWRNLGTGDV